MTRFIQPNQARKEIIFDELFNNFFNIGVYGNPYHHEHTVNETDDAIELSIDVPGFEKSDISITYKDNELLIHAKSNDESIQRQSIRRTYPIPNIDIKKSSANLTNGVLAITLEKTGTAKKQSLKIT